MESATAPHPIGGIVLAAGRSTRMGKPKPLLDANGQSFLAACIGTLLNAGCESVVAVVASEEEAAAARKAGSRVAWNQAEDAEQIDSLRIGLKALDRETMEQASAALVLPVDHPLVTAGTVTALLRSAGEHHAAVIRPLYQEQPGHPTVFPRSFWARLCDDDLPDGARSVIEDAEVVDVPVEDAGVIADIDTPDAYREHFGEEP